MNECLEHHTCSCNEELKKYKEAYEVLREANEFYADTEIYRRPAFCRDNEDREIDKIDHEKISMNFWAGGKRAREATKQVEEILK